MGGYNVDEYVRTVFDNFQVVCTDNQTCADTQPLRDDFPAYIKAYSFPLFLTYIDIKCD